MVGIADTVTCAGAMPPFAALIVQVPEAGGAQVVRPTPVRLTVTVSGWVAVPFVARTCQLWSVEPLRPLTVALVALPTGVHVVHGVEMPGTRQYSYPVAPVLAVHCRVVDALMAVAPRAGAVVANAPSVLGPALAAELTAAEASSMPRPQVAVEQVLPAGNAADVF